MIYIPIFVNIVLLLLFDYRRLSFSLCSAPYCRNRLGIYGCSTQLSVQLHTAGFHENYASQEGRIFMKSTSSRRIKRDSVVLHLIKPRRWRQG